MEHGGGSFPLPGSLIKLNMEIIIIDYNPFQGLKPHGRIEQFHLDALDFVVSMYSPEEKLALLNLSYEQIQSGLDSYYAHFKRQLNGLLKANMVDAEYGYPFSLANALEYLDLEYKSTITFKRLLANGKVPIDHIVKLLEHIEKEYRHKGTGKTA